MRKILFVFFLIIFCNEILSQEYTPMLEIGKIWNMRYWDDVPLPPDAPLDANNFNLIIEETLVINGFNYYNLKNNFQNNYLRENVADKEIYKLVNNVEVLLFDFNLNVGDFIPDNFNLFSSPQTILSVEYGDFFGIQNLKYFNLNCGDKVVEGIGLLSSGINYVSDICVSGLEGNSLINMNVQDYTLMLEIGKIWNMQHYDNFLPGNNYDFNISLDNLITVNGIEYFEASNGDLFREDIVLKKVYQLNNNVEKLILDFDVGIGDDLISPLIIIDEATFSKTITEVGTDTFYGIPNLKYYRTDCGEQIIEAIGVQTTGLFDVSSGCSLVDFDEGDLLINMNHPLSLNNYFIQHNISLFYNHSNKKLQLTNEVNVKIEIYSILGKNMITTEINNSLDVSQLQKGIYFYTLSNNNIFNKGKVLIF